MDFNTITHTEVLAVWGAITGTIGTITGILGLWLRFRHQRRDQANLKCEAIFDFEISNGIPTPKYKIVIRNIGHRSVRIDSVEYFYKPKIFKDSIFRHILWKSGKFYSKNELSKFKDIVIAESSKLEVKIEDFRLNSLEHIAKVRILDQAGRQWKVSWPNKKLLKINTIHNEIDRIEKETNRVVCKIIGYELKDRLYIFAQWNRNPPNKNTLTSRMFYFDNKRNYSKKLHDIKNGLLEKLMNEEIKEIN